jgi:hypothetical protein
VSESQLPKMASTSALSPDWYATARQAIKLSHPSIAAKTTWTYFGTKNT